MAERNDKRHNKTSYLAKHCESKVIFGLIRLIHNKGTNMLCILKEKSSIFNTLCISLYIFWCVNDTYKKLLNHYGRSPELAAMTWAAMAAV